MENSTKAANRRFVEEMSARKANADTQFFWNQVQRNRHFQHGAGGRHNRMSKAREQAELFETDGHLERGVIEDSIPVERSGPFVEDIPPLNHFSELSAKIPPFVERNVQLMKYQLPTPIQKHAVPFGLQGLDLMCCAQTVRT
jgi:superfamily II DNA/RNA helicase